MKLGIDKKFSFLYKSMHCDLSNFSEFHQHYDSASYILFNESWIISYSVAEQPDVILTTNCCIHHFVKYQQIGSKLTE